MFGKILGAVIGERLASRNSKLTGSLVGAAVPAIAKRGLGPLVLVAAAGWGAKKLWDRRRARNDAA